MANRYDIIENPAKITEFKQEEYKRKIEEFGNCLVEVVNPFQDIKKYKKAQAQFGGLKKRLEKIATNQDFKVMSLEYHQNALKILGYSLRAFYAFRNSESSRHLDLSVEFTKLLEVPDMGYVDKILENTPLGYRQKELEDQLKDKKLSTEEIDNLLKKYNLESPKITNLSGNYEKQLENKNSRLKICFSRLIKKLF